MNKQQNVIAGAPLCLLQRKITTLRLRKSSGCSPLRRAVSFSFIALAWFALSPTVPAADGGLPNQNTAEGEGALSSLTTGANNTAVGFNALYSLTTGSEATATGSLALANDTFGFNTAYGFNALYSSTTGFANTAIGRNALFGHVTGDHNTATGGAALFLNADGTGNTATGRAALANGTTGSTNTATGWQTLFNNTGDDNTADGAFALYSNTTGTGNIALGRNAGINLTTGDNNIDIGNEGVAHESNRVRIGTVGIHKRIFIAGIYGVAAAQGVAVYVNSSGQLGTLTSSARFKQNIQAMDDASDALLSLRPVTFRYKKEIDPEGIPQFGLVAEEVAKVNPDLVARDANGKVYTVRYEAINAMLLNEFIKEHRRVEQQEATITQVKSTVAKQEAAIAQQQKDFQSTVAQQQKEIKALTASLREQASQIQKVSDQLEMSEPAPRVVVNNQ
jgi:hypothetical protein